MDGMTDARPALPGRRHAAQDELGLATAARMPLVIGTAEPVLQRTLRASISCAGVALHSGLMTRMTLLPAEPGTGIVFVRTDVGGSSVGGASVAARHDRVVDSRLCTVIADGAARVGTIEHLMAAFAGAGIDNARVELDGPELPILDGCAESFLFLIDCAGTVTQAAPRQVIQVLRPVRVEQDQCWAELLPCGGAGVPGFDLALTIEFTASAIGRQSCALRLTAQSFRHELASARTFTQADEVAQLRAAGLALGGSLDNAVVVDGDAVLNPGGLRMQSEFVRHKLLDAVGDLALAGAPLHGRFIGHRSGHALNNRLLHALFADPANWRRVDADAAEWLAAA